MLFFVVLVLFLAISRENSAPVVIPSTSPGKDRCPLCAEFMKDSLKTLEEAIEGGIFVSCADLCIHVPKVPYEGCVLFCSVLGLEGFIKLIKKADLDPLWTCQELKFCPVADCPIEICGKFTSHMITPKVIDVSGPMPGHEFVYTEFDIYNLTGPGEIRIIVEYPMASTAPDLIYDHLWPEGFVQQHYKWNYEINFPEAHELCNGDADVNITLCQGWCGSRHPNARQFDFIHDIFTITGAPDDC